MNTLLQIGDVVKVTTAYTEKQKVYPNEYPNLEEKVGTVESIQQFFCGMELDTPIVTVRFKCKPALFWSFYFNDELMKLDNK